MVDINTILQYFFSGDFLGGFEAIYLSAFHSYYELFYALLTLIILVPIYIRTQSLLFVSLLWTLVSGFLLIAMPMVSVVGVVMLALGLGAMFFQLYMSRSY